MKVRKMMLVAAVVASAIGSTGAAQADATQEVLASYNDGTSGLLSGVAYELNTSASLDAGGKAVSPTCTFRVDTTTGNKVLLQIGGVATSTVDASPETVLAARPVATELQCLAKDRLGNVVLTKTQAESGAAAATHAFVEVTNNGPYTICSRAEAKYENGTDIAFDMLCEEPL